MDSSEFLILENDSNFCGNFQYPEVIKIACLPSNIETAAFKEIIISNQIINLETISGFGLSEPPPLIWLKNPDKKNIPEQNFMKKNGKANGTEEKRIIIKENILLRSANDVKRKPWQRSNINQQEMQQNESVISTNTSKFDPTIPRSQPAVEQYKCNNCSFQSNLNTDLFHHQEKKLCVPNNDMKNTLIPVQTSADPLDVRMILCSLCKLLFLYQADLDKHLLSSHKDIAAKIYKCTQCSYETMFVEHLMTHQNTHQQLLKCHCNSQTYKTEDFFKHVTEYHKSLILTKSVKVKVDVKSQLKKRILRCSRCLYTTNKGYKYRRHMKKHKFRKSITDREDIEITQNDCFRCKNCSFTTRYIHYLRWHLERHNKESTGEAT